MRNWLSKLLILIVLVGAGSTALSQNKSYDTELLLSTLHGKTHFNQEKITFHLPDKKNKIIKYNPLNLAMASAMYLYQGLFSSQIAASCMYNPTCSRFSSALIEEYGFLKGVFLAADRLSRCNPITAAGIPGWKWDHHDHKIHETVDIYRLHEAH